MLPFPQRTKQEKAISVLSNGKIAYIRLTFALFLFSIFISESRASDQGFSVKFTEKKAVFSGQVDSEETAQALAKAVKQVRPDIEIVNKGMLIKSSMAMPPLNELTSVLAELGLSTHEGTFRLNDESITISGLTDSMITSTALMIRLEPVLGNRRLISRICIVPTEDLPDIPIYLADGKEVGPLLDFEPKPTAEDSFTIPGMPPHKLISLALFISQSPELGGQSTPLTATPRRLRAVPIMLGGTSEQPASAAVEQPKPKETSTLARLSSISLNGPSRPKPTYEALSPILFSRNTFLLQANQDPAIQGNVKQLQETRLAGKRLIIRAMKPGSGSETFNDWLCQRRADEVKKILSERGIPEATMATEIVHSKKNGDNGEVKLFAVIPPPEPEAIPEVVTERVPPSPTTEKKTPIVNGTTQ